MLKSNKVSNEVSAVNQSEIDNYGYQTNYLMSNKMSASGQAHDEDSLHQRKTTSQPSNMRAAKPAAGTQTSEFGDLQNNLVSFSGKNVAVGPL